MAEVAFERIEHDGSAGDATLASTITSGTTSIPLQSGHGWALSGGTGKFWIRIDTETILCSALSGDTITADTRGADGTTAAAHSADATVEHVFAGKEADEANQVVDRFNTSAELETAGIADDAVTAAKIADDAVDTAQLADGAVDTARLGADAVTGAKIADDTIDSEHYVAASIDNEHLADSAVDTAELAADAVTGAKIEDDAVNSEHIAAGAIDLAHMSANSVDSDQYVDGSIDRVHLAADVVDGTKLADDAVNSEHIADGAIDTVHHAIAPQQGAHELTNNLNPATTPGEIYGTADVITNPGGAVTLTATVTCYMHTDGGAGTQLKVDISDDGGSTWAAADYAEGISANAAAASVPRVPATAQAFYSGTPTGNIHIRAWLTDLGSRSGNLTVANGGLTWTMVPA